MIRVDGLRFFGIALLELRAVMDDVVGVDYDIVPRFPEQARIPGIVLRQRFEIVNPQVHVGRVLRQFRQVARQIRIVDEIAVVETVGFVIYAVIGAFQSVIFREEGFDRAFADVFHIEETGASG